MSKEKSNTKSQRLYPLRDLDNPYKTTLVPVPEPVHLITTKTF